MSAQRHIDHVAQHAPRMGEGRQDAANPNGHGVGALQGLAPGHGLSDEFLSEEVVVARPASGINGYVWHDNTVPVTPPRPNTPAQPANGPASPTVPFATAAAAAAPILRPVPRLPGSRGYPSSGHARFPSPNAGFPSTPQPRRRPFRLIGPRPPTPDVAFTRSGQPILVCPVRACTYVQCNNRRCDMRRHINSHFPRAHRGLVCVGVPVDKLPQDVLEALPEELSRVWTDDETGEAYVGTGCGKVFSRKDSLQRHHRTGRCVGGRV
ncbi:hypothetical protein C8Q77DRAFT_915396 [Trametes polyzona]|nr:hypothetical protein C8Q77DRAFT_915396 [Trametes polyzona]